MGKTAQGWLVEQLAQHLFFCTLFPQNIDTPQLLFILVLNLAIGLRS